MQVFRHFDLRRFLHFWREVSEKIALVTAKSFPPSFLHHPIEAVEDDVDVGGVELGLVVEVVAHQVAVDAHPRERAS